MRLLLSCVRSDDFSSILLSGDTAVTAVFDPLAEFLPLDDTHLATIGQHVVDDNICTLFTCIFKLHGDQGSYETTELQAAVSKFQAPVVSSAV